MEESGWNAAPRSMLNIELRETWNGNWRQPSTPANFYRQCTINLGEPHSPRLLLLLPIHPSRFVLRTFCYSPTIHQQYCRRIEGWITSLEPAASSLFLYRDVGNRESLERVREICTRGVLRFFLSKRKFDDTDRIDEINESFQLSSRSIYDESKKKASLEVSW